MPLAPSILLADWLALVDADWLADVLADWLALVDADAADACCWLALSMPTAPAMCLLTLVDADWLADVLAGGSHLSTLTQMRLLRALALSMLTG